MISRWTILLTVIVTMILNIIHLPFGLNLIRPDFPLLLIVYLALFYPQHTNLTLAWLLGILTDLLTNTPLGTHALIFVLSTYLVTKFHRRIKLFAIWRQALIILVISFFSLVMLLWILGNSNHVPIWIYLMPCLSSTVLWLLVVAR